MIIKKVMDGSASVDLMSNDPKVEAQGPEPTPNQVEKFKLIDSP